MKKSLQEINETEKDFWNNNKLERSKIKMLRRHSFFYSYKKEQEVLDQLVQEFAGKNVLEIGSHSWHSWFKNGIKPKKLTCINISEAELEKGKLLAKEVNFEIEFILMDANNLTFKDETFDVVFGGAILHHLNIELVVNQIHRVLKPNGEIVFLEPLNLNPIYKLYRKLNPKERTPDEHALVKKDFKLLREKFSFNHYFFDFFSVIFGFISLKLFGDKNYDNFINKFGFELDNLTTKLPFLYFLFARVIIYGKKINQ